MLINTFGYKTVCWTVIIQNNNYQQIDKMKRGRLQTQKKPRQMLVFFEFAQTVNRYLQRSNVDVLNSTR